MGIEFSAQAGHRLVLCLSGDLTLKTTSDELGKLEKTLNGFPSIKQIELDSDRLAVWDSGLLVLLLRVERWADERGIAFVTSSAPQGLQNLLKLATAVPAPEGSIREPVRDGFLDRLGKSVLALWDDVGDSVEFIGESLMAGGRLLRGQARFRRSEFWLVVQETGADALPIVTLISILVGVILAFIGAVQLALFGAEIFVANLVALGMAREMGAMMAAIIMAGRTGAAFAAQLGSMQANEEIDALRTMGVSPMEFLVLPRMLALMAMMPLLAIYAMFLGILGGAILSISLFAINPLAYYTQSLQFIGLVDFAGGVFKAVLFGMIVAITGCYQGMNSGRDSAAVGQATTRAVVSGIVLIVVVDALMTVIYFILGI